MSETKKVEVTVLRPFRIKGKRLEVGDVVSLDVHLANEMIAAVKAAKGKVKVAAPADEKK